VEGNACGGREDGREEIFGCLVERSGLGEKVEIGEVLVELVLEAASGNF
jgi:hypothetical protein